MIRKEDAAKIYPRNTPVLNRGDKGWTSDAGRETEAALADPRMQRVGYQRKLTARVERNYSEWTDNLNWKDNPNRMSYWEVGDRVRVEDGPDRLTFEYKGDDQWRFCFRERNAAL